MQSRIQIRAAAAIDATRWNERVTRSSNGLIYSRYDYLNQICDDWQGIIVDDYQAVMAIPIRKKFGIRYGYEPAFTQQLGFIGTLSIDIAPAIFRFIRYGDLLLNFDNLALAQKVAATRRTNLVIDLSVGYGTIAAQYKKDLQQNLNKAEKQMLAVDRQSNINDAVSLYQMHYHQRMPHVSNADFSRFENLCFVLQEQDMCFTRTVRDAEGSLLSIGLFLKDEKRIYNMMNTTTEKGRTTEANQFLLDSILKEFAGEKLLFDFEGSDIPGIKNFYSKFGAKDQPYFHLHFNKLPFPLRLLGR